MEFLIENIENKKNLENSLENLEKFRTNQQLNCFELNKYLIVLTTYLLFWRNSKQISKI